MRLVVEDPKAWLESLIVLTLTERAFSSIYVRFGPSSCQGSLYTTVHFVYFDMFIIYIYVYKVQSSLHPSADVSTPSTSAFSSPANSLPFNERYVQLTRRKSLNSIFNSILPFPSFLPQHISTVLNSICTTFMPSPSLKFLLCSKRSIGGWINHNLQLPHNLYNFTILPFSVFTPSYPQLPLPLMQNTSTTCTFCCYPEI